MNYLLSITNLQLSTFRKNWGWFFVWGLILVVLGLCAIGAATATTLISVVFLGFLLLAGGIVIIINSFAFWWGQWGDFFLHLVMGLLYTIFGIMLINHPVVGSISITWLLGILYSLLGIFRIGYAITTSGAKFGWTLFNGIIALLLGILILANWPASSLYIIGLFVGIDLLFCGWAFIMASLSARSLGAAERR